MFEVQDGPGGKIITVGDELTITGVAELHPAVRAGVDSGEPMTLDLRAVSSCDTAGAQLVLAAHVSAGHQATCLVGDAVARALTAIGADVGAFPDHADDGDEACPDDASAGVDVDGTPGPGGQIEDAGAGDDRIEEEAPHE